MKHPRIKRAALWLLLFCLTAALTGLEPTDAAAAETAGEVVGYYAAWAPWRGYGPDRLDAGAFTQINFAFAAIDGSTGKAVLEDPGRDAGTLRDLTALRKKNPQLKIVLSIGGWDHSTYFSDAASTAARRETFAQSCLDLILAHDLDGIDLDWEYPVSGGSGVIHRPQDKQNFTLLLKALRQKLDRQGQRDGRDYRLTIAGASGSWYLNNIEPQAVAEVVDHVFLMTYDFSGPWSSRSGFNAPLYGADSTDSAVTAWLSRGAAAEKLVLGIPLYGYIYQGVSSAGNGLNSAFSSARSVTYDAVKTAYLTDSAYRQLRHATAQVPYLYGQRTFLSYDDPVSVAAKAELARDRGLGGIGFWELSQDTGGELVSAARTAWLAGAESGFRDVPEDAWYAEAVAEVFAAGLMQGTGSGLFSPGGSVSRGMAAAILHRLAGEPEAAGTPFSDVSNSDYYAAAAAWAAERGIVTGYADGTFRPHLPVSRQQLAALLWRYADWADADLARPADLAGYRDAHDVAAYAVEPLGWAVRAGLIQGTAAGDLLPQGGALRGQTAVILCRFLELLEA